MKGLSRFEIRIGKGILLQRSPSLKSLRKSRELIYRANAHEESVELKAQREHGARDRRKARGLSTCSRKAYGALHGEEPFVEKPERRMELETPKLQDLGTRRSVELTLSSRQQATAMPSPAAGGSPAESAPKRKAIFSDAWARRQSMEPEEHTASFGARKA